MKTPEMWNPLPSQLELATSLKWIPLFGPELLGGGSPGPPAGASAFGFRWRVPSGASYWMSLFEASELNVIEWSPTTHQVTEPPTGILTTFGPNSSIWPLELDCGAPEPTSTGFSPG